MIQFWVQIHDLGLGKFNEVNVEQIGNNIGKYIEVEKEREKATTCYMRIKLEVDASQSSFAGFWWTNSKGKENRASIKYERLSDFFYGCCMLGHTMQGCKGEVQLLE